MSNRQLEERMEREHDAQIADALGISAEDYELLEARIEPVDSDGGTVGWDVYFEEGSDPEVIAKIPGAEVGGFKRIGYIDFDGPDEPDHI